MPHIHEKIDFTADVFIVHKNRVLLRVHDKYKIWLGIGGHIELHEDPNQAVVREAKEEVGLDIELYHGNKPDFQDLPDYKELIPPMFLNRHRISETHEHVHMIFFGTTKTDKITQEKTEERSPEIRWFTAEELDDPKYDLYEHVRFYAQQALKTLES